MIAFDSETKQAYKDYDREIKAIGNLYLAKRRLSNNLFESLLIKTWDYALTRYGYDGEFLQEGQTYTVYSSIYPIHMKISDNPDGYTDFEETLYNNYTFTYTRNPNNIGAEKYIMFSYTEDNVGTINLTNENIKIMIAEGSIINEYEPYGEYVNDYTQFQLTEENECKILSFNINEKTDIYYTSLPYNEMTIEVDNEKGYFTDYDPDSIVNKLNQDCYVDLFISINDGNYIKIMTMKFDEISSSDYEKAKLSFKSNISLLKNLQLRDKNMIFNNSEIYKNDLKKYIVDNYNIEMLFDNNTNDIMYKLGFAEKMTVENILLHSATRYGTLEKAVLTLNDTQDRIVQRTWKKEPQDIILLDYQQEKPIVKREDVYRGVHRKYIRASNWENTGETFNYILNGKLTAKKESIVLFNANYRINQITNNDITVSGSVNINAIPTSAYEALNIFISGNIGDEYTLTINKTNIMKKISNNYSEENIAVADDTTKIINITETAPLLGGYYNFILSEKQIKSNIEAKIFGLPYLEIGDTVEIETDNAKILMTIAEIDMNYDGGLLETIKGYELGWDALFPADDLYPSDDLYPNTPI